MTFERSPEGQSNRALFLNVDLVCYVEGAANSQEGDDVHFWHNIFGCLRPDLSIKYIGRGGKPVLERLARQVVDNDITNTLVAMDADYSRFLPGMYINDKRVFYTYGYSWESDIFGPDLSADAHKVVCRRAATPQNVVEKHGELWKRIELPFRRTVMADFLAFCAGSSVVNSDKPGQILQKSSSGEPLFRIDQVFNLIYIAKKKTEPRNFRKTNDFPVDGFRYMKGRVTEIASRIIINFGVITMAHRKASTEAHIREICLEQFFRDVARPQPRSAAGAFHRAQISRLQSCEAT